MIKKKLFGTDGIRGPVGVYPLTESAIYKLGKVIGLWLQRTETAECQPRCVIGKDTRFSGEFLETAFSRGILSEGIEVINLGVMPTPAVAFFTRFFKAGSGIVISASHNTQNDNGLKLFNSLGYKLSDSEEEALEDIFFNSNFGSKIYPFKRVSSVNSAELQNQYINFLKRSVGDLSLEGRRIAIDCGQGAISELAFNFFQQLGAKVTTINDNPNGENINLNCGALYPQEVARCVLECDADIGLSFDGDADRVIVTDEKGNILDGDYIMAVLGTHMLKNKGLPKSALVATHMSNSGLEIAMENLGGKVIRTEIGDKFVLRKMVKEKLSFGGEQSGHIIFLNHATTPDGMITSLQILRAMFESGKTLSELRHCMHKVPQVLANVRVREKKPFVEMPKITELICRSEQKLKGRGRIFIRYSGTEPVARIMIEGENKKLIEEIAVGLTQKIQEEIGCPN